MYYLTLLIIGLIASLALVKVNKQQAQTILLGVLLIFSQNSMAIDATGPVERSDTHQSNTLEILSMSCTEREEKFQCERLKQGVSEDRRWMYLDCSDSDRSIAMTCGGVFISSSIAGYVASKAVAAGVGALGLGTFLKVLGVAGVVAGTAYGLYKGLPKSMECFADTKRKDEMLEPYFIYHNIPKDQRGFSAGWSCELIEKRLRNMFEKLKIRKFQVDQNKTRFEEELNRLNERYPDRKERNRLRLERQYPEESRTLRKNEQAVIDTMKRKVETEVKFHEELKRLIAAYPCGNIRLLAKFACGGLAAGTGAGVARARQFFRQSTVRKTKSETAVRAVSGESLEDALEGGVGDVLETSTQWGSRPPQ